MKPLSTVQEKIRVKNPKHYQKIMLHTNQLGDDYEELSNRFLLKYDNYLQKQGLSLDYGIDCYLHLIDDMLNARLDFIRSGTYANTSFAAVEKSIYGNSEVMQYHMHGLVLAQFLWFDQYERIVFFIDNFKDYANKGGKYLEIGGGHGLYINEAFRLNSSLERFDLVDISESSLKLAQGILNTDKINYILKNIFDFSDYEKYQFITMGEVIEHVEDPLALLNKTASLLTNEGVCYLTTPVNAPMIDHIYLFNNTEEIRQLISKAGLEIIKDKTVISENMDAAKAARMKVPIMYAAFAKAKR